MIPFKILTVVSLKGYHRRGPVWSW